MKRTLFCMALCIGAVTGSVARAMHEIPVWTGTDESAYDVSSTDNAATDALRDYLSSTDDGADVTL